MNWLLKYVPSLDFSICFYDSFLSAHSYTYAESNVSIILMFNFHTIGKNESRTKIVIDHKSNRLEIHTPPDLDKVRRSGGISCYFSENYFSGCLLAH